MQTLAVCVIQYGCFLNIKSNSCSNTTVFDDGPRLSYWHLLLVSKQQYCFWNTSLIKNSKDFNMREGFTAMSRIVEARGQIYMRTPIHVQCLPFPTIVLTFVPSHVQLVGSFSRFALSVFLSRQWTDGSEIICFLVRLILKLNLNPSSHQPCQGRRFLWPQLIAGWRIWASPLRA